MIALPAYAKIRDRYCIAYFGPADDYVWEMALVRPYLEGVFAGTQVYLAHRDGLVLPFDRTLPRKNYRKEHFGAVEELACDMRTHPVEALLHRNGLEAPVVTAEARRQVDKFLPDGVLPTRSLKVRPDRPGVVGVECAEFVRLCWEGCRATLVDTGLGRGLLTRMFPFLEVIPPP